VSDPTEGLVKVFIDLPDEAGMAGESFWAKPVGPELFELRSSPWYAYDLHFGDVVHAIPNALGEIPRIREVVRPSGHKTLRIIFPKETSESEQVAILEQLQPYGASYERAFAHFVAVDVPPTGKYQQVCDALWAMEKEGRLNYETGTS
jgi:uncharacterized protein DUF4265